MIPAPVRLYRLHGADRVCVVSTQPSAGGAGGHLVRVAQGPYPGKLSKGTTYGPYPEAELVARVAEVVESLRAEGYLPSGLEAMLTALDDPHPAVRARAALRLGWRCSAEAVPAIVARMPDAVDEVCSFMDALGMIGDPAAVPALRPHAQRKLLSRRRSAAEALRNLGDVQGLAEVRQLALDRLPDAVRAALTATGENANEWAAVVKVAEAVLAQPVQQRGLAIDTLYELGTPAAVLAVRGVLPQIPFAQAHVWRYVKSVFKRALLRNDFVTFGELSHAIERQARAAPCVVAVVKSGYDGVQRQTRIFGRGVQNFMRRLAWRYLRRLARYRPELYAHAAAEALVAYTPEDVEAAGGTLNTLYVAHRVLLGGSDRFMFRNRSMVFWLLSPKYAQAPAGVREEAYPELWDAQPRAYLRVLTAARMAEAHPFAVAAVRDRHWGVIASATTPEVFALLAAPYEPTVQLGLVELERRFDPGQPGWWELLLRVVGDGRAIVRNLGHRWLHSTAGLWTRSVEQILALLGAPHPDTRFLAAEVLVPYLAANSDLRGALAVQLVARLRKAEEVEGVHEVYARLAREALLGELAALLTLGEVLAWVERGSPAAQSVAGQLLGQWPNAVEELGVERLTSLAQHEIASVRAAAHALLRAAGPLLATDPSPLLVLVESEWEDTRQLAFDLLRTGIDAGRLGLEGLVGILDSNRTDVQDLGRELVLRHFAELPTSELIFRLAEHPHPYMRRFAVELVVGHLPAGAEALGRLEPFFRAALFDLWPDRRVKRQVLEFLVGRGLEDERQAGAAATILRDAVRVQGRADFERALEGLVRLKLAYPQVDGVVQVQAGGVA